MAPGELDLLLLAQGRHERPWTVLGAHPEPGGVAFAVWAPAAREVRVVFDDGAGDAPMTRLDAGGVWYAFVSGATVGVRYRYRIVGVDGAWCDKADPVGSPSTGPRRWCTRRATRGARRRPSSRGRCRCTRSISARGGPV